jgi:hypothetical protein
MSDLGETFETEHMDLGDDLIPVGEYIAQAIEAEVKETQSGGRILTFTFEVLDGGQQGRRLWERFNYVNQNEMAQRIARREMGRFAQAIGLGVFQNTDEFLFKPVLIDVVIRKDKSGNYPDQNGVKKYRPVDGGSAPARSQSSGATQQRHADKAAPPPQQRAASGGGSRPWERR